MQLQGLLGEVWVLDDETFAWQLSSTSTVRSWQCLMGKKGLSSQDAKRLRHANAKANFAFRRVLELGKK
eukprot:4522594-Amphidinium_carterae.1